VGSWLAHSMFASTTRQRLLWTLFALRA
jgi:hypothetical protein